jgi:ammonium transporter, Amt family
MSELRGAIADTSTEYLDLLTEAASGNGSQWLVTATVLVLFMQAGFLLLESGSVRSKNTINVSQKNVVDMIVSACAFFIVGAPLMFGADLGLPFLGGLVGWGGFDLGDNDTRLHLLYQFAFCATAATIISGAVAERMTFNAYLLTAAAMGVVIYPVYGHWVWGASLIPGNPAFLADMGFLDYAGSAVVHIIGGSAALAAVLLIGPRHGRFDADGKPVPMPGHSSVLALTGLLILVVGWHGFNAGSAKPGSDVFSQIVMNTMVAFSFGGAAAIIYDYWYNNGRLRTRSTISGIIGGLVAITAGCAYVGHNASAFIGIAGGLAATAGGDILLKRFKLDDPVDAIACHMIAGFVGTVLVAVFALPEFLVNGSRLDQLFVQLTGASLGVIWAGGVTFIILTGARRLGMHLRVSLADEEIGLNLSEHGEGFDVQSLKDLIAESGGTMAAASEGLGGEVVDETLAFDRDKQLGLMGKVIGAARKHEQAHREVAERLQDFEKVGNDWLWETDASMHISRISEKFMRVFGPKADAIIGRDYFALIEQHEIPVAVHRSQIARFEPFENCIYAVTGPDRVRRIFSISGMPRFDNAGNFTGYRGRALDVTEQIKADAEIRFMALHDHLTGLKNRAAFDHLAQATLAAHERVAIGSIDLDGFKAVNDSHGHQTGDELLKLVSARILSLLGDDAVVARFGGDEFVFAKPLAGEHWQAQLKGICDALVASLCTPAVIGDAELFIGGSVGIAVAPDHETRLSDLIRCSDMALYEAKQAGRGQWVMFRRELEERAKRRKRLEADMRSGIENGEFFVEYQPQVSVEERKLKGFEALLRWQHPEFGRVSPLEFVPIAEETGLIAELGAFVLREACTSAYNWPLIGGTACLISVNVSPVQFFKQDLVGLVSKVLAETGLAAERLELEITESALVKDPDEATSVLVALRALGVRVAVDDFGTGYSSLSYLQKFPLDRLKVDRAFVRNLATDGNDRRITEAIVQLGKSLGLKVIAEGVETEEQRSTLNELACDEIQGFLYSPPVSTAATLAMIVKANEADPIELPGVRLPLRMA